MNKSYYNQFVKYLDAELKDKAIKYALSLIEEKKITLEECYLELLSPSLSNFVCNSDDEEICIWKEHARTSIIRTILESTYPYVIKRKESVIDQKKSIVVVCPSEEFHEIGAIIVSFFFALAGYHSLYIGANTPKNEIISAVNTFRPDYIALSVTNYYNLIVTKKITEEIKTNYPEVKIIVGGQAFLHPGALEQIQYDYHLLNFDQIATMGEDNL